MGCKIKRINKFKVIYNYMLSVRLVWVVGDFVVKIKFKLFIVFVCYSYENV